MENKEKRKQRKIIPYFLGMLLLFVLIDIFQQFGVGVLYSSFTYLKYGMEIITEAIWAVLVLILVLIFRNSYIFKEKREKIGKSLYFGLPIIIISVVNLIAGIINTNQSFTIPVVLNLATYCILIGIAEEFLCRGWLLNEFLERFSDSKKHILLSIFLSSLVFGMMHITNILAGQTVLDTVMQILNATFMGMVFAFIYYKTKNIWSVVLIHAFWDFALMLPETVYLGDAIYGETTTFIKFYSVFVAIIAIISLGILCFYFCKKIKFTEEDTENHNSKLTTVILPLIAIVAYCAVVNIVPSQYNDYVSYQIYDSKYLGDEYETYYYFHKEYQIKVEKQIGVSNDDLKNGTDNNSNPTSTMVECNYKLYLNDDSQLILTNINTKDEIVLFDSNVSDYLLFENENSYSILIETDDMNLVYYMTINKDEVTNDSSFLTLVKNGLVKYNTPFINSIGVINANNYNYALVITNTSDFLYIDTDNVMYLNAE